MESWNLMLGKARCVSPKSVATVSPPCSEGMRLGWKARTGCGKGHIRHSERAVSGDDANVFPREVTLLEAGKPNSAWFANDNASGRPIPNRN